MVHKVRSIFGQKASELRIKPDWCEESGFNLRLIPLAFWFAMRYTLNYQLLGNYFQAYQLARRAAHHANEIAPPLRRV